MVGHLLKKSRQIKNDYAKGKGLKGKILHLLLSLRMRRLTDDRLLLNK